LHGTGQADRFGPPAEVGSSSGATIRLNRARAASSSAPPLAADSARERVLCADAADGAGATIVELPSKAAAIAWTTRFGDVVKVNEIEIRQTPEWLNQKQSAHPQCPGV
jgi:hypothetical protein